MRSTMRNQKEQRVKHVSENAPRLHASESHLLARFAVYYARFVCFIMNKIFWP